jgi:hypothetical protein
MKSTRVDADGTVRCPVCGATAFDQKRTGKAKIVGFATVGVGVVAMPKRLKCRGCGTNLKRGNGQSTTVAAPPAPEATLARLDRSLTRPSRNDIRKKAE